MAGCGTFRNLNFWEAFRNMMITVVCYNGYDEFLIILASMISLE
jgi:hypothetical protein